MQTGSSTLQIKVDEAYKRGDFAEVIELIELARKALSSDQARLELQERIYG